MTGGLAKRAPMDRVEGEICAILAIAIDATAPMEPDDDFFDVGGDSVRATLAAMALQEALAVPVTVRDILIWPQPGELAAELRSRLAGDLAVPSGDPRRILVLPHESDAALLRFAEHDGVTRVNPYVSTPTTGDLDRYLSVPDLAEQLRESLGPVRPQLVIGYCSATPLAYELARACAAATGFAPRVLLVEPSIGSVDVVQLRSVLGTHQPDDWLSRLLPWVPPAFRVDSPQPSVRVDDPEAVYPCLAAMVREHITDLVGLPETPASAGVGQRLSDVHLAHVRGMLASARYDYQPAGLDVTVLAPCDDAARLSFWRGVRPRVRVVELPAHHEELLMSPTTWQLADEYGAGPQSRGGS